MSRIEKYRSSKEYFLPHEAYILTNLEDTTQFSINKILLAHEVWKNQHKELPLELEIHLTNRCRLNCSYCSYKNRRNIDQLSLEEVKSIIDQSVHSDLRSIFFSGGGDPLTWEHWDEILDYIKNLNEELLVGVATNALGLRKSISRLQDISFFQIHLIGYDSDSYKGEAGVDRFDEMINDIEYLMSNRNAKSEVAFKILIDSKNYININKYLGLVQKLKPDTIIFKLKQDFENNYDEDQKIDISKLTSVIENSELYDDYKHVINNLHNEQFLDDVEPKDCYIVKSNMYCLVRPDGEVFPCIASPYDVKNSLGNIRNKEFREILKNTEARQKNCMNMVEKKCPRTACRHYRFNQTIERHDNLKTSNLNMGMKLPNLV